MNLKNTIDTYGALAKSFHWGMAVIILSLILVGFYMESMANSPQKFEIYTLHKSFGLLVLWLAGVRLIWRWMNEKPQAESSHAMWERLLARCTHGLLYVCMIGMPLSGWMMSAAGGHAVSFFGIPMFEVIGKDPAFSKLMNQTHGILAYIFVGLIALHALGAMKHHFIDRDMTMKRMMFERFSGFMPYLIVMLLGAFFIIFAMLTFF